MDLPILTVDTAPAASRPILEGIAADLGFIPNLAAAIAASPTLLGAFDGLRRAVGNESFDPRVRETAGVAVGVAVDNAYGVAFHSTVLGRLGVAEDDIEAMRQGSEPGVTAGGDGLAAAYAFSRALVLDRGDVDPTIVERALAAGLTPPDLLQLLAEGVFASLVGLVDNLAGHVALDEFLRPRAWK
jgi:alkylhydroperoxidase family enzyme